MTAPNTKEIVDLIVKKIVTDKVELIGMLETQESIANFDRQATLLASYQAGVKALHILTGKMTHDGRPILDPKAFTKVVDIDAFEAKLRENVGAL